MNSITRRHLLMTTALIPIAACAQLAPVISVVTDPKVAAILAALKPWIDGLGVLPAWLTGIATPETVARVAGWIAQLNDIAGQIGGVTSVGSAIPLLKLLAPILSNIMAALPAGTIPANISSLLTAAVTYLPTILMIAGLFMRPAPQPLMYAQGQMTPEQALAVLQAAAASRR